MCIFPYGRFALTNLMQERLAAAQAAEMIVRQSLNAGGGRMTGTGSGMGPMGSGPRR
jgi:hypothetical protein